VQLVLKNQYFMMLDVHALQTRSGQMWLDLEHLIRLIEEDRRTSGAGIQSYLVAADDAVLPGFATVR